MKMNSSKMKTATHFFARRLAMTLLALLMTVPTWAQLKGDGTQESPYLINSSDDWMVFTENINIKGVGTTSYYKLTSDISLGTTEEPLNTIVGTDNKFFRGNFDGDFHTINIIMNRTETYAAPFGVTDGATIRNLKVTGTITTTKKFAGGIIAYSNNKSGKATNLINCISSIHIICDGIETVQSHKPYDCTHGGLVGQNETGVLNFENCIFDGWIKDFTAEKRANKCTGFVAWVNNTVNYTNCTMAGVIDVKPNDDELPNSMANYHRLANSAKANFKGTSYYINDYTYEGMPQQGVQAYLESPANTISKVYVDDSRCYYYVPGAVVTNDEITYYGWKLTKGTDYVIEKVSTTEDNKLVTRGINAYGGSYSVDVDPTCKMKYTVWDDDTKTGWQAIASPIDGQKFENVNHLTTKERHNIYRYDEEKGQWQEYRNLANVYTEFENGRGYLYRSEDGRASLGFNGDLIEDDVACSLSYTEGNRFKGLNLIGNPFTHEIYKGVAISNELLEEGYCTLNANGTWSFQTDDVAIEAGKAIFVQAVKGGNLKIKNTDEAPAMRASNDNIWLTVENNEYRDVACVEFKEGHGFNKIAHYNEDAPMLYVKHNGESFASADMSDDTRVINLSFEAKQMGRFTLSINAKGNFDYIHLIDRMTGEDVDMLSEDSYSFIASSGDNADRFIVRLASVNDNASTGSETFAWQNGGNVIVKGAGELQVFDVTGRMVIDTDINGEEMINLASQGVYVMRLVGNEVKTQKIVVR